MTPLERIRETLHPTRPSYCAEPLSIEDARWLLDRLDELTSDRWMPTAENINVLPERIRSYIHQLETRCDPAGDTRELIIARGTCKALEAELDRLRLTDETLAAEAHGSSLMFSQLANSPELARFPGEANQCARAAGMLMQIAHRLKGTS